MGILLLPPKLLLTVVIQLELLPPLLLPEARLHLPEALGFPLLQKRIIDAQRWPLVRRDRAICPLPSVLLCPQEHLRDEVHRPSGELPAGQERREEVHHRGLLAELRARLHEVRQHVARQATPVEVIGGLDLLQGVPARPPQVLAEEHAEARHRTRLWGEGVPRRDEQIQGPAAGARVKDGALAGLAQDLPA